MRPSQSSAALRLDVPSSVERVCSVMDDGARVQLEPSGEVARVLAGIVLEEGDDVLCAHGADGVYVLGALRRDRAKVQTREGVAAQVSVREGHEVLQVTDAQGRMVFEYDAALNRTTVGVPVGDLVLQAPQGHVDIQAGHSVRMHAEHEVDLRASRKVSLQVETDSDRPSRLQVDADGAAVSGHEVKVTAHHATGMIEHAKLVARSYHSTVETIRTVAGVIETQAGRVMERMKNAYREIEQLAQTRAGRIRMVARETATIKAQTASITAEQDVKVAGEKVYIG